MMTGIQNGSEFWSYYYSITLIILGILALYDIKYHKVKNKALLCFLPWSCLAMIQTPISSILGFSCAVILLLVTAIIGKEGIGGGDIKLIALLGMIFGLYGILFILILASILALLLSFLIKEKRIPFVPFLSIACSMLFVLSFLQEFF